MSEVLQSSGITQILLQSTMDILKKILRDTGVGYTLSWWLGFFILPI